MSAWSVRLGIGLATAGVLATSLWLAVARPPADEKKVPEERLRPRWSVGDQWIVETVSQPFQARREIEADKDKQAEADKPVPVRWLFQVKKTEKLGANECLLIEVAALEPDQPVDKAKPDPAQPRTRLWFDARAMALRQMQTQLPVPGGFTWVTENYQFGDGQPGPVLTLLTALPVDLPVFVPGKSGGEQSFSYEAFSGPTGKRDPSDVGFAVDVSQSIKPVTLAQVKGLVPAEYSKDLEVKPLVEVKLKAPDREVRQVWQAGQPWPVYSNNGSTEARLIPIPKAASDK